jgi:hypothetical protein
MTGTLRSSAVNRFGLVWFGTIQLRAGADLEIHPGSTILMTQLEDTLN